jgi:hypothetical protein
MAFNAYFIPAPGTQVLQLVTNKAETSFYLECLVWSPLRWQVKES